MHSLLIGVWLLISSVVIRANVYDDKIEPSKSVVLYQKVNGQYQYYQAWVKDNG